MKDLTVATHVLLFSLNLLEPRPGKVSFLVYLLHNLQLKRTVVSLVFPRDSIQDGRKLQKRVFGLLNLAFKTSVGM